MACKPAVTFTNVHFSYGGPPVLESIEFDICAGDFVSIVGPNGGGKTTMLRLMMGLLVPTRGTVTVLGDSPERARPRIGYMPQYTRHDPTFPISVREVVLMGRLGMRRSFGPYSSADREAALRALAEVQVEDLVDRPYATLSGGQRQRVLVARALAGDPELLLLDEPTANVDIQAEEHIYEVLRRLNQRLTIVMVSHDLGFVSKFVKSVVCVKRTAVLHPTSAITGEVINQLYGMDMRLVRHDHRCAEEGHQCLPS